MEKIKTIYCITNLKNNKKYIGSTIIKPEIRFRQHIYNSTHQNAHQYNYPLYQAFRKYGLENFKFDIIYQKECGEEEIREIERDYILKYNSLSPNGYNQTLDTVHPLNDPMTYKKMKETKREKAKRVALVDKDFKILRIWRSIIDCAEDGVADKRKIAAVCRGERRTTNGKIFCWLDDNDNLIIPNYNRDCYKGEKGTTQIQSSSKKVAKIDLNTGEILNTYPTIALASRENNCDPSGISKTCKGLRNKCGGFFWKYI